MDQRRTDHRSSASVNLALMLVVLLVPLIDRTTIAPYDPEKQRPWGCRTCTIPASDAVQPEGDPGL